MNDFKSFILLKTQMIVIAVYGSRRKNFKLRLIFSLMLLSTYNFAAFPIIGSYWAFSPCSSVIPSAQSVKHESNGKVSIGNNELYDKKTYRGELGIHLVKLLSNALHENICVSAEPSSMAVSDPTWWLLLPKPLGLLELEKRKFPISVLKQITVFPNKDGTYCSSLVVNKKSNLRSLADLHGKQIIIPSYSSVGSYIYPNSILKNYLKRYNIKYKTGVIGQSKIELAKNYFNSETSNDSALMIWDNELEIYKKRYRTLLQFCGIPDYILIANNKLVSKKQVKEINKALEKYHFHHISWINPDRESFNLFYNAIKSEIKDNEL